MVRINLLPVRVSKKKEAGKQQLLLFALVLVLGLFANGWYHKLRADELDAVEKRVTKTKADIAQLDKIIGEVKSIRVQQQQLQEKLDVLDKLKQGRTGPVRMLDELTSITPKRLWLTKMEEKDGKVTFTGGATNVEDVSQFMAALKTSKYFADVELKKTEGKTDKAFRTVVFTIGATAKYSPGLVEAASPPKADGPPPASPAPAKGKG
jgi:type IV pilus assembly protein PilN